MAEIKWNDYDITINMSSSVKELKDDFGEGYEEAVIRSLLTHISNQRTDELLSNITINTRRR